MILTAAIFEVSPVAWPHLKYFTKTVSCTHYKSVDPVPISILLTGKGIAREFK